VRKRADFPTRFCHEAVVFGSAFSDTRFGAKRTEGDDVAGNDEEHFVNESGNRAGLVVGPTCGIGKMAQRGQRGQAWYIDICKENGSRKYIFYEAQPSASA